MAAIPTDQGAVSISATKAVSPLLGVASYRRAVKHLLTSVVREICTLRSVGAGARATPGHPVAISNGCPYRDPGRVKRMITSISTSSSSERVARFASLPTPRPDYCPVWSADGRYIAFVHGLPSTKAYYYIIPRSGGSRTQDCRSKHGKLRFWPMYGLVS